MLSAITAPAGTTVAVGAKLGELEAGAAGKAAAPAAAAPAAAKAAPAAAPAPAAVSSDKQPGPAARKALSEAGLDATAVSGSGKDGRVTKPDVAAAVAAPKAAAPAAPRALGPREERVKMTRLRSRIAERLKHAQNTAAMLTTFNEVDMTAAMAMRSKYNETFEKRHGIKLGFMSIFAKACVVALKELPAVNAEIDAGDIVYKNHYDIGIAVGTPQGLVVPVVRDCDALSFADIEKKIGDFGRRARDGKLTVDEMSGGTFTITNGGIYGSLMSTPILNPPQSGILGMHKIQPRPIAVGDKIEIRPMMYLALSYDHRIIDGREAVTFLVRVKECIEDPARLILDM
jgi:2-oxoglutarate dehydrogenase E2 component (dihydrolipoamide succinyltransferase)